MDTLNDPRHKLSSNDELERILVDNILKDYALGLTVEDISKRYVVDHYKVKGIIYHHMLT